jgi:hypothetical protein
MTYLTPWLAESVIAELDPAEPEGICAVLPLTASRKRRAGFATIRHLAKPGQCRRCFATVMPLREDEPGRLSYASGTCPRSKGGSLDASIGVAAGALGPPQQWRIWNRAAARFERLLGLLKLSSGRLRPRPG